MPVEIKGWHVRCDRCGCCYGERAYFDTEEEAKAYHEEGGGLCADCAEGD